MRYPQIDWPGGIVAYLTEDASRSGMSLDEYLLVRVLGTPPAAIPRHRSPEARQRAVENIRKLSKETFWGPI